MHALLNFHDDLEPNIPIFKGDYVVSNTNDFGLVKDERYEVLEVNSLDLITIKLRGEAECMYSVEYFNSVER